jgi:hypothetical protein
LRHGCASCPIPYFASFLSTGLDVLDATDGMSVASLLSRRPSSALVFRARRLGTELARVEVAHFGLHAPRVFGRLADDFRIRRRSGSLRRIDGGVSLLL